MPRGVYDRSKTKSQRAAAPAKIVKAGKKYGKKMYGKAAKSTDVVAAAPQAAYEAAHSLSALEHYFNTLVSARNGNLTSDGEVGKAIHNTLARMETLAEQIQPWSEKIAATESTIEEKAETKVAAKAVKAPHITPAVSAPVAVPAPVPFNPHAVAAPNGAA
jgi:leucyl aminopeptidase (aminopeptidase T)